MHTRSLCLNDAFSLVRDRKPDVSPNFHFMEQLHSFERQLQINPSPHRTLTLNTINNPLSASSTSSSSSSSSSTATVKECDSCSASERVKYTTAACNECTSSCIENKCKCIQTDFLVRAKTTGVSPDSGIEFDRWTPNL